MMLFNDCYTVTELEAKQALAQHDVQRLHLLIKCRITKKLLDMIRKWASSHYHFLLCREIENVIRKRHT